MKQQIFTGIKYLSTILITGAIGLELWHLYTVFSDRSFSAWLHPMLWLGRFALVAHLIEGVIAAIYAPRKQKSPLSYGTYTFFVGTIGLSELFALDVAKVKRIED
jgi:hypothetical protein